MKKVIYFTTREDYKKLHHLPFNRDYGFRNELAEKMAKYGFVGAIILIYTDLFSTDGKKYYYVADGQNRAATATQLGIEFTGIVVDVEFKTVEEIVHFVASLNSTQRQWNPSDYIKTFIHLHYPDYITLRDVKKTCTFTFTTIASMLYGWRSRGYVSDMIEDGTFKVNMLKETEYTLSLAAKLSAIVRSKMSSRMALALHYVSSLKQFNEEKFTEKYVANYNEIREKSLDDYSDVFAEWLN
jgi:hypothetical protein